MFARRLKLLLAGLSAEDCGWAEAEGDLGGASGGGAADEPVGWVYWKWEDTSGLVELLCSPLLKRMKYALDSRRMPVALAGRPPPAAALDGGRVDAALEGRGGTLRPGSTALVEE